MTRLIALLSRVSGTGVCRACTAAAFACALLHAAPARADLPSGFVGMNVDGPALEPAADISQELHRIARTGVRSVRWTVAWSVLQPYRSWDDVPGARRAEFTDVGGVPTDFTAADRFIAAAVQAGLTPLPVVIDSAPWAAENPYVEFSPPTDLSSFGTFTHMLAARYGARGSFWDEHPKLPRRPVRRWQIWNEEAGLDGFTPSSWWWMQTQRDTLAVYVGLLEAARQGLEAADPGAELVLGGLWGKSWIALEQLYDAGAGHLFDAVAIHPYTLRVRNVTRILAAARAVMKRHGDRDKPLYVTELSWPSAVGRIASPLEFSVTERGQARNVAAGFRRLARARHRLRLRAVYWYAWIRDEGSGTGSFDFAGLLAREADGSVRRKPAFFAFRRTVRRLGG
jgi:hypothetical protein